MNAIAFYQKKGVNFDVSEGSKSVLSKLNAVSSILSAVPGLAGTVSAFQNVISIKDSVLSLRTNASEKIDSVVKTIDNTQTILNKAQSYLSDKQADANDNAYETSQAISDDLVGVGPTKVWTPAESISKLQNESNFNEQIIGPTTKAVTKATEQLENAKANLLKAKEHLTVVDGYIVKIENSLTDFGNVILFKLRNCVVSLDTKGPGSMEAFIPNAANNAANDEIAKITKNITTLQNNSIKSVNSILKIAANPFR